MKALPLPILLLALNLIHPLAASAQTTKTGESPAPPPASDKPTMVGLGQEEEPEENPLPKEGLVRMEVFTLSREDARAATRKFHKQADLYAWLSAELEKEKPTVKLERLMVLRVRGGQKSKLEEIAEYPSPTHFDPPRIPQTITIGTQDPTKSPSPVAAPTAFPAKSDSDSSATPPITPSRPAGSSPAGRVFSPWPYSTPTPQSFAYKNLGWTTEIELTIADDGKTVDLNIAPEFIRLCGLENQSPAGGVVQPVFETSKIATQIITKFDQPTLAGTFSPPVDAGAAGGNLEAITRLLFLTVTDPR